MNQQVIEHLKISGYRGFDLLELSDLGQINIFVGNNNSGKTSLLEAIALLCNPLDPFQWLEVSQRRVYFGRSAIVRPDLQAISWLFPKTIDSSPDELYPSKISIALSGSTSIQKMDAHLGLIYQGVQQGGGDFDEDVMSAEIDDNMLSLGQEFVNPGIELSIKTHVTSEQQELSSGNIEVSKKVFQFWENQRFVQRNRSKPLVKSETIFPSYTSSDPILERLSKVILREDGSKNDILELIRSFDDNILDFQILSTPTARATLYIEHKDLGFAPFYVFGDGFKRAFVMALTLLAISDGVLLIDEIETSIHVSALGRIFAWLIESCRSRSIQLFVTTHSLEAIDAMLQPSVTADDLVAFRLNSTRQAPRRLSKDLLYRLRSERGLDVR